MRTIGAGYCVCAIISVQADLHVRSGRHHDFEACVEEPPFHRETVLQWQHASAGAEENGNGPERTSTVPPTAWPVRRTNVRSRPRDATLRTRTVGVFDGQRTSSAIGQP